MNLTPEQIKWVVENLGIPGVLSLVLGGPSRKLLVYLYTTYLPARAGAIKEQALAMTNLTSLLADLKIAFQAFGEDMDMIQEDIAIIRDNAGLPKRPRRKAKIVELAPETVK